MTSTEMLLSPVWSPMASVDTRTLLLAPEKVNAACAAAMAPPPAVNANGGCAASRTNVPPPGASSPVMMAK